MRPVAELTPGEVVRRGEVGPKEVIEVGLRNDFQPSEVLNAGVTDQPVQAVILGYHRAAQLVGLRR